MKKYTYQAKNFDEAKNMALVDLMEQQDNLYIKEIESSNRLFSKKSVIEVIKKSDVVDYIKDLIKDVVGYMGLSVNMEVKKRDDNVTISIYSDNNAILIGKNARTLDALTTFVKQAVYREIGVFYNLVIDVSEYKQKQQYFIERAAKQTAREVLKTKVAAQLEPMNSYERRIVHNALSDFNGVYTESVGEEPHRCVVIKPMLDEE